MPFTLYGIRNCDTMKKARAWLDAAAIPYRFHDYRKDGVPEQALRRWVARLGLDEVLNRRGTTFRKLAAEARAALDGEGAIRFLLSEPAAIRRPMLEGDGVLLAGFVPACYQKLRPTGGENE